MIGCPLVPLSPLSPSTHLSQTVQLRRATFIIRSSPALPPVKWFHEMALSALHSLHLCTLLPPPPIRWFHEMALSALHSLHLCTLAPFTRRLVAGVMLPNQRPGMAVLLWAATPPSSAFLSHDPEV